MFLEITVTLLTYNNEPNQGWPSSFVTLISLGGLLRTPVQLLIDGAQRMWVKQLSSHLASGFHNKRFAIKLRCKKVHFVFETKTSQLHWTSSATFFFVLIFTSLIVCWWREKLLFWVASSELFVIKRNFQRPTYATFDIKYPL